MGGKQMEGSMSITTALWRRLQTLYSDRLRPSASSPALRSGNSSSQASLDASWTENDDQLDDGWGGRRVARDPDHILVLANGLFGNPSNWKVVIEKLTLFEVLQEKKTLIYVSNVNTYTKTFDGLDVCGNRLADEIRAVTARHPTLTRISMLGHSMGGLMLRYAAGALYDAERGTISGLQPCHFISMASPHLGCSAEGVSQVPFIGWAAEMPVMGGTLLSVLDMASIPISTYMLKRTGAHLFLADGGRDADGGPPPLLVLMTQDAPGHPPFLSALRSFRSRTCYANSDWDHIVGWANSSLRAAHELPCLASTVAADDVGVVLEDDLAAAFVEEGAASIAAQLAAGAIRDARVAAAQLQVQDGAAAQAAADAGGGAQSAASSGSGRSRPMEERARGWQQPGKGMQPHRSRSTGTLPTTLAVERESSAASTATPDQPAGQPGSVSRRAALEREMLAQLAGLGWRRIDVRWQRAQLPMFAHNNIQVTRRWMNWEGESVTSHLAQQLVVMEQVLDRWDRLRTASSGVRPENAAASGQGY